ncbi:MULTISPECIES: alpha/beta hydrolase [unclassified Microbacterium]|uniref:alpha/beta hydrolase n=1 Tax=unclassified Microbacterium TaxID=2609290 RepID=UPI000EA97443|nr:MULTISPECIES: alpha/beta hydrolase [unclassified Microbacterium]MBT2483446.1 alpha/beta hydrolase [Microbacterium sp. ISL-108]RKN66471.1 alpha/beta hydrolase [Microbacterium sp. CGR2]
MSTAPRAEESDRPKKARRPWHRTKIAIAAVAAVAALVAIIGSLTPWPSAMVIRAVFTKGGDETAAEMDKHVPETKLTERLDVGYGDAGADTTMDVFRPATASEPLPTVVWIHGGAWISGAKENVDPYLRILAAEGYTTIGVNYTIGPEGVYPLAVHQLDDALAYIDEHADELGVDPDRIVLAGDSAGAQLASQMATLITNPDYADIMGISPSLAADQVVATVLNCGVYDLARLAQLDGIAGWGFKSAMWAYSGTRTWAEDSTGATMSTVDWVTADFPTTYISGGNGDDLTWLQSIPMAQRLEDLGVDTTTLFWPAHHEPELPHEYQFHLDMPDARTALEKTVEFLNAHTGR